MNITLLKYTNNTNTKQILNMIEKNTPEFSLNTIIDKLGRSKKITEYTTAIGVPLLIIILEYKTVQYSGTILKFSARSHIQKQEHPKKTTKIYDSTHQIARRCEDHNIIYLEFGYHNIYMQMNTEPTMLERCLELNIQRIFRSTHND